MTTDGKAISAIDLDGLSAAEKRALLADRLRRRHKRRFPVSFPQQRLWFLHRLAPDDPAYNIGNAARINGLLDLEIWRDSAAEVVRRHEALRTTFEEVEGEPVQVVAAAADLDLTVVDCAHLRGPEQEADLQALAREEFNRPFDLRTGPLVRQRFLRLGPDEHVLLFTVHHIVADIWSMSIFIEELVSLYTGSCAGRAVRLPEPRIQYPDYAAWQRQRLDGGEFAADLAYWRQALRDAPSTIGLPTDRRRPQAQSNRGGSTPFDVPGPVLAGLRTVSRHEGATPFMTMLAAFLVLLHRYSREDDIVVGIPVADRGQAETERLIGFLVNTLALRTDLSGDPSFRAVVGRVRQVCLDAYAHQELPFERLVEELQPERDLSRHPVFQVFFVFQNRPLLDLDVPGLRMAHWHVPSTSARFDLELHIFDAPDDGLTGWFDYNSELFDGDTIERMSDHLRTLAANLVAEPDRPVGQVPMLSADEERRLRECRNDTRRDWSGPLLAHRRFESWAARTPDSPALRFEEQVLDYGELDSRANRLAHRLRATGVRAETLVGVCLTHSPRIVVAFLAVMKAGGAFLPLDPRLPADRLAFTMADSGMSVLLTERALVPDLPPVRTPVLCLDELAGEPAGEPATRPEVDVRPDDLAYTVYTSGSTGRPKGVQIPHRGLDNFLRATKERPGIGTDDVAISVSSLAFDLIIHEVLLPLTEGAQVVLADRAVAADSERLADLLTDSGVTMMMATPTRWRMLLDAGWTGGKGFRAIIGGEALPPDLARRLLATGVELWNIYGLTEISIWSSTTRVNRGPATLGDPIANTEFHVLEAGGPLLAPFGVPGELCIGGAGLGRGYLGRPALTAERFIPHPFSTEPGARLFRTRDLVRRRADGGIEFLGRMDHQVKLRGFRIELGEVEAVLAGQPGVGQAAVAVRSDDSGDQRLVAYVVVKEGAGEPAGAADGEEPGRREESGPRELPGLRAGLAEKLPDYMVPSAFVYLDELPMTPTGKIDRGALPVPERGRHEPASTYTAPRSAAEAVVAGIWADALGLEKVGVHDDFFALGGYSLLSTRVVYRIRDALGVDLPLHLLFSRPTVAGLTTALLTDSGDPDSVEKAAELLIRLNAVADDEPDQAVGGSSPAEPTRTTEGASS